MADKTNKKIATAHNGDNSGPAFGDVRWSPDSRWLTFADNADNASNKSCSIASHGRDHALNHGSL